MAGVVIVGGGQAAASLSSELRTLGYPGAVTIVSEEPHPPYQRPPLSKAYLLGDMDREQLFLRPAAQYDKDGIALRLGQRAEAIDPGAKTISVGGETLAYDHLVLATGAMPRRLPEAIGGALGGVHTVRGLGDIDTLAPLVRPGRRLLVIGGGYIGLEAVAVARKIGLEVTVIEAAARILQRVAAPQTADLIRALHESHGVRIREATGLERLLDEDGQVTGAILAGGERVQADLVVTGIGVAPATGLAEAAGLTIDNGIAVDAFGRSSDPAIWALGDCASFPHGPVRIRLESVGNAIDQARIVAANIAGTPTPYRAKPWFWSDQYDVKLQIAGLNLGYDRAILRQEDSQGASVWYYAGDRLLAVDALNNARAYMTGKRILDAGKSVAAELVQDTGIDAKGLLAAAV